MKHKNVKRFLAVLMASAMLATSVPSAVFGAAEDVVAAEETISDEGEAQVVSEAAEEEETALIGEEQAGEDSIESTALASYDFDDYSADGDTLVNSVDATKNMKLEAEGSGVKPVLAEDSVRGKVLSTSEQSYANRAYALLPSNPFAGQSIDNGLTLSFWTKTTGSADGGKCLIDFEVKPATSGRAGTLAVNQQMMYWNTTDQNSNFMDFSLGELNLATKDVWSMVTIVWTTDTVYLYSNGRKVSYTITSSNAINYEQMIKDLAGQLADSPDETNVRLGASLATYWSSAGAYLDDISFYGSALSSTDIYQLYMETNPEFVAIPSTSVAVSSSVDVVGVGETTQLTASMEPSNTTDFIKWSSGDESVATVDENGVVTGVKAGTVKITATATSGQKAEAELTIKAPYTSLEEGKYLAVYTTTTQYYASAANIEQETRSVYFAVSEDGKNFRVINNGNGVIYSSNTNGTLQIANPKIFKDGDKFLVVAPDYTGSKGYHHFTSTDGVNYRDDVLEDVPQMWDVGLDKNSFTFTNGDTDLIAKDTNVTIGNAVKLTDEEYTYIVNKLDDVVNNGLAALEDVDVDVNTTSTVEDVQKVLEETRGKATATYTDGSTQEFNIDWSSALENLDLSKNGQVTVTGNVVQTKYLNNLKELNGSTAPDDDPDNENTNYPENYDPETGKVYYDETKFVEGMADPCIYWDEQTGYYYMTGSYFPEDGDEIDSSDNCQAYDRIVLRRATTLEGLQSRKNQVTIWKVGNQGYINSSDAEVGRGYRYIWAPEIHRVGNNWVVYFTESQSSSNAYGIYSHALVLDGNLDPYETALKASDEESQWQDYQMRTVGTSSYKSLATSFCLDMTYFKDEVNGQSYVIWAGKPTASYQGSSTDLFIATVDEDEPWKVTSPETRLTCSEYGWERVRYCVNEGPTVLQKDGKIFMCYSVSGTGSEYAIGMCSAAGGEDLLDINQWTKSPYPLLTSRDVAGEEGPGHNSFTVDKDGNAIFVYHARPTSHNYQQCGNYNGDPLLDPCRHARLKRVHWAADGTPILKMTYDEELLEENTKISVTLNITGAKEETPTPTPDVTPSVAKVTGVKATATTNTVKLSWKKVTGATGYVIERAKGSSSTYKKLKTIKSGSTVSFTNKKLAKGTGYKYRVYAYVTQDGVDYPGAKSSVKKIVTKPAQVTKLTVKRTTAVGKNTKATLSFKKATGATRYEIRTYNKSTKKWVIAYKVQNNKLYKYNTSTKKYTKVSSVSTKSGKLVCKLTKLNLKNAKSMKFKVRAVTVKSGYTSTYGAYSKTVTLK